MDENDQIIFTRHGQLAIATLNRPAALNAQNLAMVRAFRAQLRIWEADPTVTTLLIRGAGGKAFCAGGDVRAIWQEPDPAARMAFFTDEYALCYELAKTRLETVAYMDGITMGGGVGLSIFANHRIATPRSMWAMPETAIGFFPDIAAAYFLPRLKVGTGFGRYLGLTGARLDGAGCLAAGIATHYMASDISDSLIERLARGENLAGMDAPESDVAECAAALTPYADAPLEQFLATLSAHGWLPQGLSSLAIAVTDAALSIGSRLSHEQVVQMDFRMVTEFLRQESFREGVRARLIDKDNAPNWPPIAPYQLNMAEILRFFRP